MHEGGDTELFRGWELEQRLGQGDGPRAERPERRVEAHRTVQSPTSRDSTTSYCAAFTGAAQYSGNGLEKQRTKVCVRKAESKGVC